MPTIVVPVINVTPTIYSPSVGVETVATGDESAPVYDVRMVTMHGALIEDLTNAEPDTVTWTLNQPDAAEFHFPKNAYAIADFQALDGNSEAQIYRNGQLLTWGPLVGLTAGGSDGAVHAHVAGVEWYLNRRFIDAPIVNHILNDDFESSTSNWTANGSVTFTVDGDSYKTGANSAKLVAAASGDNHIAQSGVFGPNGVGVLVVASAWFYIDTITAPALETRGLYIEGIEAGTFKVNNYYVIDTATPTKKWVKASTTIWVPPNKTWTINLRLYAPAGTVRWDDVKLVDMESIGSAGITGSTLIPADISQIIRSILILVQSSSRGKSDVNIGMHSETTGIKLIKDYQFADHVQFDQAMREYIERDDGIDYNIDLTPTSRTYHQHAAKRGTDRSATVTLRYDVANPSTSNCPNYSYTADGGSLITRQIVLGEDHGPDREVGEHDDPTDVNGLVLQDVRQAPQGAEPAALQRLAVERIRKYSLLPETVVMDVLGSTGLIPTLKCGDIVTIVINDGYIQVNDTRRIMQIALNCVTNVISVTCVKDLLI